MKAQRYLTILKHDAQNLFHRILEREKEVMEDFSLKRDRSIFEEIFFSRYESMTVSELAHFSIEIIELANDYYQEVSELHWYIKHTQDMPNAIQDEMLRTISILRRRIENLVLYIDAELGGKEVEDHEGE